MKKQLFTIAALSLLTSAAFAFGGGSNAVITKNAAANNCQASIDWEINSEQDFTVTNGLPGVLRIFINANRANYDGTFKYDPATVKCGNTTYTLQPGSGLTCVLGLGEIATVKVSPKPNGEKGYAAGAYSVINS